MLALVIVLALGAVVGLGATIQRSVALSAARRRVIELEAERDVLSGDLTAAANRADSADARATKATAEAAAATRGSEAAKVEVASLTTEVERERSNRIVAEQDRLAEAERARRAEAELAHWPAEGVWALETRRIGRTWRDHVSVTLDGESPIIRASDPAEVAAQVLADASREETGVVVDVAWHLDDPLVGAEAVLGVRLIEELIATARGADGADLDVSRVGDDLTLVLRTDPAVLPEDALVAAVAACGAALDVGPDRHITIRRPR